MTRAAAGILVLGALLLSACDDAPAPKAPDTAGVRAEQTSDLQRQTAANRARLRAHFFSETASRCTPPWRADELRARMNGVTDQLAATPAGTATDARLDAWREVNAAVRADLDTLEAVAGNLPDWVERARLARRELGRIAHELDGRLRQAARARPQAARTIDERRQALLSHFTATGPDWRTVQEIRSDPMPRDCLGLARAVRTIEAEIPRARETLDATRDFLDSLG